MTVSLASIAATAESQTSVAADYPASIAADDLLLYFVGSKSNTSSHGVPSGFALLDNDTAGAGSEASDTGSVVASAFDKNATGSESGTEACAITSGAVAQGFIARLTRSGGSGFDVVSTTARWTTDNTDPISVAFDDAIDFAVDDVVLVFVGLNTNGHTNIVSPVFTASGITFGSQTAQRFTRTNLGTDMSVSLHSAVVTAGSGSVVASFEATKSTSTQGEGPLILVRIREDAGGGDVSLALSGAAATTATGNTAASITTALTGISSTTAAGTLSAGADVSVALTGVSSTTAAGSTAASISTALAGISATTATGTLSAGGDAAVSVTGQAASTAQGTLGVSASGSAALTGALSTAATGTITASISAALTGASAAVSAGSVTAGGDVSVTITGQAVSTAQGTIGVTATGAVTVALTGAAAVIAAGDIFVTVPVVGWTPVDDSISNAWIPVDDSNAALWA